jgi:N utilization substance protein B
MLNTKIRRRARERALQFLFGLDFTLYEWQEALEDFWTVNPAGPGVRQYARKLICGVKDHQEALDEEIRGALENWTPSRLGYVERNVLRIGLFEMRHVQDVPQNVAINEAVEVAKTYGTDEAPRFINGVLDRLKEEEPRRAGL